MKMCCHKEKRGGTRRPKKIVNGSVGNPCSFCLTVQSSVQFLTYSVNGTSSLEYTYSLPNKQVYVMVPSEEKIQTAKGYLDMLYRNEYITVTQE